MQLIDVVLHRAIWTILNWLWVPNQTQVGHQSPGWSATSYQLFGQAPSQNQIKGKWTEDQEDR